MAAEGLLPSGRHGAHRPGGRRGLTERESASLTGIPQSTISEIESGLANPTLATLAELAHALGGRIGVDRGVEPGG